MSDQNPSPPEATVSSSTSSNSGGTPPAGEKPRIKMQLYKTEPCQNWTLYGVCRYGNLCKFAHGMTEQRSRLRHPMYKTSLCKDFPLGKCSFGNRCNFAHSLDELRINTDGQVGITGNMQTGSEGSPQNPPAQQQTKQTSPEQQQQQQSQLTQQPQLTQAKKFPKRYKQQQQLQALLQTPITMLPDGRLLSTFTPITANMGSDGGTPASTTSPSALSLSKAKGSTYAGELRKYQSTGTLRTTNQLTPNTASFPNAQQTQQTQQQQQQQQFVPGSALALQDMDDYSPTSFMLSQNQQVAASVHSPIATAHQHHSSLVAGTPPSSVQLLTNQQAFVHYETAKQQQQQPPSLHQHFQKQQEEHANVARRVSSLSQLPSLRTASSHISQPPSSMALPAAAAQGALGPGAVGSGNLLLQSSFQPHSLGPVSVGQGSGGGGGFGHHQNYQNHHHRRESSFAITPLDIHSPSPSFRENDEGITPPPHQLQQQQHHHQLQTPVQPDYSSILNESDFSRLSISNTAAAPPLQQQQQNQYLHQHSAQRRMLTSSVSMQTLPRFKLPVNWGEQQLANQPHRRQPSILALAAASSASPSANNVPQHVAAAGVVNGSSSQSSAATLIDSDVWSNTPPALPPSNSNGILGHFDAVVQSSSGNKQLYESRFFPSAATSGGGTAAAASPGFSGSSGGAFSLASPAAALGPVVDPLGIYYPTLSNNQPHHASSSARHQHLRRQQSTDDWMLLGQSRAYEPPNVNTADGMSPSVGPPFSTTTTGGNTDNRLSSLDQLRVAAANRRQFNPLMNDSSSVYLF